MSGWDWPVAVGVAWIVLSVVTSLIIGPFLRTCSEAREAVDDNVRATLEMDVQPS